MERMDRRTFFLITSVSIALPRLAQSTARDIWSASEAASALYGNRIFLIDVRSREEWSETGLAKGAWPISMHEPRLEQRLIAARALAGRKPIALICATGGRSAQLLRALKRAGYTGYIDVSEGMLGSSQGRGWIARGLPVVDMKTALAALPRELR